MANLIGASKIVDNATVRARTSAAIRQAAAERGEAGGSSGALARAALLNPEFVIPAFLVRVATNTAVAAAACVDCGYPDVEDADIAFVVAQSWDDVAAAEFPEAGGA